MLVIGTNFFKNAYRLYCGDYPKTSVTIAAKNLLARSTADERPVGIGRHTAAIYLCDVQCIAKRRVASGNAEDGNYYASCEETRTGPEEPQNYRPISRGR